MSKSKHLQLRRQRNKGKNASKPKKQTRRTGQIRNLYDGARTGESLHQVQATA